MDGHKLKRMVKTIKRVNDRILEDEARGDKFIRSPPCSSSASPSGLSARLALVAI